MSYILDVRNHMYNLKYQTIISLFNINLNTKKKKTDNRQKYGMGMSF